ncbi:hypothetical protein [Bradyrhizobium sp.]|uniref:hypothetical protein n=1 Tax=Bradyrhizobium sp. TaxID=376 RepID=UPI003BAF5EB6
MAKAASNFLKRRTTEYPATITQTIGPENERTRCALDLRRQQRPTLIQDTQAAPQRHVFVVEFVGDADTVDAVAIAQQLDRHGGGDALRNLAAFAIGGIELAAQLLVLWKPVTADFGDGFFRFLIAQVASCADDALAHRLAL